MTLLFALALVLGACGTATTEDAAVDAGSASDRGISSESSAGVADDEEPSTSSEQAAAPSDDDAEQTPEAEASDGADSDSEAPDLAAVDGPTLGSSILADTLQQAPEISSGRFEGNFTFVGTPGTDAPSTATMTFSGAFDEAANASEMTIDFSDFMQAAAGDSDAEGLELFAGFFDEPIRVITIGDTAWTNMSFLSALLGGTADGDLWIEGSAEGNNDTAAELGLGGPGEPNELLKMIQGGRADVEELGTEELRGVNTTHYRALVDGESLAESMTAEERAEVEASLGDLSSGVQPMDFWIDDDGLVRKYLIDVTDPSGIDDDITAAQLVFEMWDLGEAISITPPPADQIVSEDELDFGFGQD